MSRDLSQRPAPGQVLDNEWPGACIARRRTGILSAVITRVTFKDIAESVYEDSCMFHDVAADAM